MNKRVLAYLSIVGLTAFICFGASQMQLINTTAPGDSLKVGGGKMNTNALILETNIITMSNQFFIGSNIFGLLRTNNLKEGANVTITVDTTNGVTIGMASTSNSGIAVLNGTGTNLTVAGTFNATNLVDKITNVSHVDFNQNTASGNQPARIRWNTNDVTLDIGLTAAVTLQIGQEMIMRGRNNTGSTITNGYVVYISGALGNRPTMALADNSTYTIATKTIAVATENVTNNTDGFFTSFGLVRDLDTSGFNEGDTLYLSTAGTMTTNVPVPPSPVVIIGTCVYSHNNNGIILVHISPKQNLGSISDVSLGATATDQIITWNPALNVWTNAYSLQDITNGVSLNTNQFESASVGNIRSGALLTNIVATGTIYTTNNVKFYGAVGDGVTDDTLSFSNAVVALRTNKGALYIPAGNYVVTSVDISGLSLVYGDGGEASGTIITHSQNATDDLFYVETVPTIRPIVRDIYVLGKKESNIRNVRRLTAVNSRLSFTASSAPPANIIGSYCFFYATNNGSYRYLGAGAVESVSGNDFTIYSGTDLYANETSGGTLLNTTNYVAFGVLNTENAVSTWDSSKAGYCAFNVISLGGYLTLQNVRIQDFHVGIRRSAGISVRLNNVSIFNSIFAGIYCPHAAGSDDIIDNVYIGGNYALQTGASSESITVTNSSYRNSRFGAYLQGTALTIGYMQVYNNVLNVFGTSLIKTRFSRLYSELSTIDNVRFDASEVSIGSLITTSVGGTTGNNNYGIILNSSSRIDVNSADFGLAADNYVAGYAVRSFGAGFTRINHLLNSTGFKTNEIIVTGSGTLKFLHGTNSFYVAEDATISGNASITGTNYVGTLHVTNTITSTNLDERLGALIQNNDGFGTNVTLYGTENFALEFTTGTLTVTNSNSTIPSYLKTNQIIAGANVTVTDNGDNTLTIASTGGGGGPVSSLTNVVMYQQVYYNTATNDPTTTQIFISLTNAETVLVLTNTILSTNISIFTTNQWASTNGTLYANVMLTQSLTNSIALSFPSQWKWQGVSAPTALASNAVALLSLKKYITSGDTVETNIIAGYNVTP